MTILQSTDSPQAPGQVTSEHILQRAFELARSGTCRDLVELEMTLKREGFEQVGAHSRVRAVRVVRDYAMFDRREAPQYFPDAAGRDTIHA